MERLTQVTKVRGLHEEFIFSFLQVNHFLWIILNTELLYYYVTSNFFTCAANIAPFQNRTLKYVRHWHGMIWAEGVQSSSKLPKFEILWICAGTSIALNYCHLRDHPFKTSAHLRGGGVKNWPNLPTDSSKKLPTEGGRGQKSWKFADVLNEWSPTIING